MAGVTDNTDEDWRSNLSNWRNRRKSHSSTQRLNEASDEELNHVDKEKEELEQQSRRRPKTFKEMMAEKERRLGNFSNYSYDDDIIPKTLGRKGSTSDQDVAPEDLQDYTTSAASAGAERNVNNNSNGNREDTNTFNHQQTSLRTDSTPLRQRTRESPAQTNNKSDATDTTISRPANTKRYSEKITKISQRPNNEKGFGFTIKSVSGGSGILIERVTRGSSADVNELKSNDEILSLNGIDVSEKSVSAVQDLLSSAAKVGQIELKIRRLLENGAEEDVFEEDEFIMSQQRRQNKRQSYGESELSTPPPSPPRLSLSDYNDEPPPPLPNLPPPPPNWNTFPGAEPPPTVSEEKVVQNNPPLNSKISATAPATRHTSVVRDDSKQSAETSKEESLRKRFEFLGLSVENSEEYKRILEEKEEIKAVQASDASAAVAEEKSAVSAYIASITEKKRDDLPSTLTNKSSTFDPYEVYKSSNEYPGKPDAKSDFSADRAKLKREAEERYNKEQEELAKRSAVRRSIQSPSSSEPPPVEPVSAPLRENREDVQKDEVDSNSQLLTNRQKVENLRDEILKESRVSPRDTYVGSLKNPEQDDLKESLSKPVTVKMNMRGTESLPYRGVEDTFPNLQESPWSSKSQAAANQNSSPRQADGNRYNSTSVIRRDGVGGSLDLSSGIQETRRRASPVGSDRRMDGSDNASKYATKPSTMFAPQPYVRPNHSRSSSSDILKSGSDFHQRQLSGSSDVALGSERTSKKLARSFDNSAKIIIGKHSVPSSSTSTQIESRISPRDEIKPKTATEDMNKVRMDEHKFEANTVNLPLSSSLPPQRQSEPVAKGGASFSGPLATPPVYNNNNSREQTQQGFQKEVESFRRPQYSTGEPQYAQSVAHNFAGPTYNRSTSVEPARNRENSYSKTQTAAPVRDYVKARTSSVGELTTGDGSNIAFLLYGENNGSSVPTKSEPRDPRWIEPSRKSLTDTYSSTAQLIDNYKRLAPASDSNLGRPGTSVIDPRGIPNYRRSGVDGSFNDPVDFSNSNRRSSSTSYNNGNSSGSVGIPLSSKITFDPDYNVINPNERFIYEPVKTNIRSPSSSDYNSIPVSDRYVKDLVQSYIIPNNAAAIQTQTRRPSESAKYSTLSSTNRYVQPSYNAGYHKPNADYLNNKPNTDYENYNVDYQKSKSLNRNSVHDQPPNSSYRNPPESYIQPNTDDFIPLQSRLVSDRPPRNGEPWSPSSSSPKMRDFPGNNSVGSAHWVVEEAERRRVSESSGKTRPRSMHHTITTEENPNIRIPGGVNSRVATLNRLPSTSVQNLYAAQTNYASEVRPNNYDPRRQTLNPQQSVRSNGPAPNNFPSSPTFQWYSGAEASNKHRSTNPSNSMMVVPGANDRARITAHPSASYVASGAVDSLFSHMGSGPVRDVPNNNNNSSAGSNLILQRSSSRSQGNLYPVGSSQIPMTSSRSNQNYGYDYDNTGYNAAGLKYSQL